MTQRHRKSLRNNSGLLAARKLFELGDDKRSLHKLAESISSLHAVARAVAGIAVHINPDCGAAAPSPAEPEDDPRAVREQEADTLADTHLRKRI